MSLTSHLFFLRTPRNFQQVVRAFYTTIAVSAMLLGGMGVCHAAAGGVVDNAGFFSEQAKSDATRSIADMERRYHKDLFIETFKEIPPELRNGVNVQDKAAAGRICEKWALSLARQKGVNGVFVLLVKEPSHLQVLVGNDTQTLAFTLQNRDELVELMVGELRTHRNDASSAEFV